VAFLLNKNDLALLASIGENRVLTSTQIAAIHQKRKQVTRRRLRALERAGLIHANKQAQGRSRGRPEKLISLTETGADLLRSNLPDLEEIPNDTLTADKLRCVDHQLLLNWFRIHLTHIERIVPQLSVRFLSPISPFMMEEHTSKPNPYGQAPGGIQHSPKEFAPDGAFSITHQSNGKTLFFFLEVDMGTESIAGIGRGPRDLRQKILNYQHCFQASIYKRFEKILECRLDGFRLLFLTTTRGRMASISNLVLSMPPSDFIWVTATEQMLAQGLSAKIWVRGGRREAQEESILGSELACHAPIIPPKD